jgi:TatD DNase family protein
MTLFDTHFHIYEPETMPEILETAAKSNVRYLAAIGTDETDSAHLIKLTEDLPNVCCTIGVHPHEAAKAPLNNSFWKTLANHDTVRAVGEIGLDYYYEHSDRNAQWTAFEFFLELAAEVNLPAVIHCRDAYDDCAAILRDNLQNNQSFVIHSYSGTPEWADEIMELSPNAFFSFNGMVTFKKADNIREALARIPLDRVLLETDAPYLAPVPHRGKPNHPAYVLHVAERIALEKDCSLEEIAEITTANGQRFFDFYVNP